MTCFLPYMVIIGLVWLLYEWTIGYWLALRSASRTAEDAHRRLCEFEREMFALHAPVASAPALRYRCGHCERTKSA